MRMPSFTKTTAIAVVGAAIVAVGGGLLVAHDALVCNGSPNWCVVARSDLDVMHPAYVFIDDKMAGLVLAGQTERFPMTAGQVHQVQYCAPFDVAETGKKEWECSRPITSIAGGNMPLVLRSLEANVGTTSCARWRRPPCEPYRDEGGAGK